MAPDSGGTCLCVLISGVSVVVIRNKLKAFSAPVLLEIITVAIPDSIPEVLAVSHIRVVLHPKIESKTAGSEVEIPAGRAGSRAEVGSSVIGQGAGIGKKSGRAASAGIGPILVGKQKLNVGGRTVVSYRCNET